MKKILLAIVLILPLSGCAGLAESFLNLPSGILTQSVQNPVTKQQLYQIENGLTVAVVSLNVYKDKCVKKLIDQSCRNVITKLQVYTRKAPPLIRSLRSFVRNNDQVNAKVVFNSLYQLFTDFRIIAVANGVM